MSSKIYKTIDLFGNEKINFTSKKLKSNKSSFDDFEGFTEKFEKKLTTDDCYTPEAVYNVVLNYVNNIFDLKDYEIVRPFYPNGDYTKIEYNDKMVVIDNPPFSMISKICRFYIENNVKFFLFAPHLTLLGSDLNITAVVVGANVIYENRANVKTSFLSNLFQDLRVVAVPELFKELEAINVANKVNLPKYQYPLHVLTVSQMQKYVENGIPFQVKKTDCQHIRELDDQKQHKKSIFGSGLLLSDKASADKASADKASADKASADKASADKKHIITWKLSQREKEIIEKLATEY